MLAELGSQWAILLSSLRITLKVSPSVLLQIACCLLMIAWHSLLYGTVEKHSWSHHNKSHTYNSQIEFWIAWVHDAGAASLPPELTRILATVKDLDERSCGMSTFTINLLEQSVLFIKALFPALFPVVCYERRCCLQSKLIETPYKSWQSFRPFLQTWLKE